MKLPSIPAPFGLSWGLIGVVLFGLCFIALVYFFGNARYAAGVSDEKAANAERIAQIQTEASAAIREEAAAFRSQARALDRSLTQALQSIEDVPDDASATDFLLVWARADRGLRDGAGDR